MQADGDRAGRRELDGCAWTVRAQLHDGRRAGRRLDDRQQVAVSREGERDRVRRGVERHGRVERDERALGPLALRRHERPDRIERPLTLPATSARSSRQTFAVAASYTASPPSGAAASARGASSRPGAHDRVRGPCPERRSKMSNTPAVATASSRPPVAARAVMAWAARGARGAGANPPGRSPAVRDSAGVGARPGPSRRAGRSPPGLPGPRRPRPCQRAPGPGRARTAARPPRRARPRVARPRRAGRG